MRISRRERERGRKDREGDKESEIKGGMSWSMCPSELLIFGPRNQCLLMTSC